MYNCREGKTRAHTPTHAHQPLWRWLIWGFHRSLSIPSSRTRRRGSYALSRKTTSTSSQPGLLPPYVGGHGLCGTVLLALLVQKYKYWHLKSAEPHFTCFTSSKLQILTPEELQEHFFVLFLTHRHILSRTSGNSAPSRMGVVSDLHGLRWSKTILGTIKVLFSIKALFTRRQSLIFDTEAPDESRVYSVFMVAPHYCGETPMTSGTNTLNQTAEVTFDVSSQCLCPTCPPNDRWLHT